MIPITRKIVSSFGVLFNNINIREWDAENLEWKNFIKVPISYGPKEKWLYRVTQRSKLGFNDDVSITLPRMSFELTGTSYDSQRMLSKKNFYANVRDDDGNLMSKLFVGIPYDYNFSLSIMVKQFSHGVKIVEQILPFFTPQMNVTLNLTGQHNIKLDAPVILNSVSLDDQYEGDFVTRRVIVWTLNFTMKAFTFGESTIGKIIKTSVVNLGLSSGENQEKVIEFKTVPVFPGKTIDEILATDDFTYLTTQQRIE